MMLLLGFLCLVGSTSAFSLQWQDFIDWTHRITWPWTVLDLNAEGTPNLLQLAQDLNLTECVKNLERVGLDRVLNHEGWFTLFCPTDEAFRTEQFYPGDDTLTDKMRLHVARGLYNSSDFHNEEVYRSLLSQRNVRMNIYATGESTMITANGQPIVSMDHRARNGYIHIVSGVMSSVYDRSGSVISEIEDCCPQHSDVVELVKLAGLYEKLDKTEAITFLCPNNGAFVRLHPDFVIHIKRNHELLKKVLNAHVIPGTWYSAGLNTGDRLRTWQKNFVTVTKDKNGQIRFNDAVAGMTDINASNGVTHAIDSIIIPKTMVKEIKQFIKMLN